MADAVRINKKCMDMPCVSISQPKKNVFQSSDTIHVSAEVFGANVTKPDVGVKFVMDGSAEIFDYEEPFESDFYVLAGNHVIEAYLMENGEEMFGNSTHDTVSNVAVGDYYVAVGDSITYATGDYDFSDDISSDGRNTGGGYTPILMDRLAIESGYPHYIANEGGPGDESADGPPLVGDVLLPKYPEAQWFLIQYGTNDACGIFPVPSGLGLLEGESGYAGSFKDNMQQIITAVQEAGKEACLAKPPMLRGLSPFSAPFDDPENNPRNQLLTEYNAVIDGLVAYNGIQVEPPNFYDYFKYHLSDEYYDNLHPNGEGYKSMADMWYNQLAH